MQLRKPSLKIMAVVLLALVPVLSARAQEAALAIEVQPQAGPPGTTVTITGRGAAPNTAVDILVAPFRDPATCHLGRGADVATTVMADAAGRFTATDQAERLNQEQAGIIYLAKAAQGSLPRPDSNVVCFMFEEPGESRHFPETGHTVSGRFLTYWEQNGGLPVFGYPITPARNERNRDTGETYLTQWFERNRFELHPQNQPPYDVLLGRLGDDLLLARGVNWQALPPAEAAPGCMWFGQTRHNVCDQGNGIGFRTYWMSKGLEFDGRPGKSYDENLALFGYPLTEAYIETNPDGDTVLTQWFERARFEWHPNNPDQFKVLLGRLGVEALSARAEPEQPPDEVLQRSRQALAGHLDVEPEQLTLQRASEEEWPNPALGCPARDRAYPEVVTPGFQLLFSHQSRTYDIRTDNRSERIVLCQDGAPVDLTGVASSSRLHGFY